MKITKDELKDIIRECLEEQGILNEGYVNQLFMGLKIHPHQNLETTLKKHEYPGFLRLIENTNKEEDLIYIKKDSVAGFPTIKTIVERIDMVSKYGECDKTKAYYKKIKSYIDKGISSKDCELTIKWFKEVCIARINEKLKEIRSK